MTTAEEMRARTPDAECEAADEAPAAPPLLSDRIVGGLDFGLDAVVVAFALWTVVFHFSVAWSWPRDLAMGIWFATLLAAGAAAIRARRRRAPEGSAEHSRSQPSIQVPGRSRGGRGVSRSTAVFFLAGAASVAVLGGYVHGPNAWWLFSGLLLALSAAAVVAATRFSGPSPSTERTVPGWELLLVLTVAGLFVLGSAFTQRPDRDDVSYGSRAVHAEQRSGPFATRDTIYSDEAFTVSGVPPTTPLTAIEPLVGVVAALTPFTAPTITYLMVGPLVSALAVLALWRLLRTLGAPSPGLATLGAALFLVLNGDRHASFGNFSFVRSWQGKAIFAAVIVPLVWHYALSWGRGRGRSSWVGLLAANTAGVGLTTTAYLVTPTVTVLGLACAARGRDARKRLFAGAATLTYPLVVLLVARIQVIPAPTGDGAAGHPLALILAPLASVVGVLQTTAQFLAGALSIAHAEILRGQWDRILGDGVPMVVAVGSLLVAWLFVQDRPGRLALAAVPGVLVLLYFNPAVARIPENAGSFEQAGGSWWRSVWVAPVPAAVGIVASSAVLIPRRWLRRVFIAGLPMAMAAAMLSGGITVLSPDNRGVRIGSLAWDVAPVPRAAAARALSLAEPGDIVAAPQEVGEVLAVMTATVHPLVVRNLEYASPVFRPASQVEQRRTLHRAITEGLDVDQGSEVRSALAALEIRVVVTARGAVQHGSLGTVLNQAGLTEVGNDAHYSYWQR